MLRCRCDSGFEDNECDDVSYGVYIYLSVRRGIEFGLLSMSRVGW